MKTVRIHFSRSIKKFNHFSRLLQWYEGLPISHVLIELDTPGLGENFVCHSVMGSGVSIMPMSKFLKINEIMETYEVTLPKEQYIELRNNVLSNCGEHYAMMQNIGILLVDMIRRKGLSITNPWKDGKNCSEFVYVDCIPYICNIIDLYDPDLVKPSEIRKILKKNKIKPVFSKIDEI